jgi:hypothetical protein
MELPLASAWRLQDTLAIRGASLSLADINQEALKAVVAASIRAATPTAEVLVTVVDIRKPAAFTARFQRPWNALDDCLEQQISLELSEHINCII